ncbi:D-Ala-D-Ala carboxypeptidase family metallohydrolase [Moraxella nasovis]|uniref:D-Ala-D-Ala carboxypeptidase family metallohydrolase n=1 Tax=Moraxella nasovis TaxID=2904121 RepID=UPI001F61590A|nr:D-Ala-D-Ala carboxypeptidase family metallohydrolase [Moraxella nasovis]UNU74089.1 D-Ala-D-Ala carboxypeptidase family metallohydrolase [Moraxella nasovis]
MNIKHIQEQINTPADGVWGVQSQRALKHALAVGKTIKITQNISLNELLHSNTAKARGIDNIPDAGVLQNLIDSSVNLWQPVRDLLGKPIHISSGYRSPNVNRAVGGSNTSAHTFGRAIDFKCPEFGTTRQIANFLKDKLKKFDQLILEFPDENSTWIHLGYKSNAGDQRSQFLTAVKRGGRTTYLVGLK